MKFSHIRLLSSLLILLSLAFGALGVIPAQAGAPAKGPTPNIGIDTAPQTPITQLIIKYKPSVTAFIHPSQANEMQTLSQVAGVSLRYKRAMSGDAHVLTLAQGLSPDQAQAVAENLMTSPDIEYAVPDRIMTITNDQPFDIAPAPAARALQVSPNDPQYSNQWHYYETWGINAPAAWDITTGSTNVVVAVIDTGITNHVEFSGRTVPGYDFISSATVANDGDGRDSDPSDPGDWVAVNECGAGSPAENSSWHGTHTTGTIAANSNNGAGVTGINWNSKILPIRALGKCGGSNSDILDAMTWAAGLSVPGVPTNTNPAKVLNLSLGGYGACDTVTQNTINAVTAAGSVVVVSAGNANQNALNYTPASCNNVITVGATNRSGDRSYYSNFGISLAISAPGGAQSFVNDPNGVLSTINTGTQGPASDSYAYYQGTSMAAPHVSGVVSLMLSVNPLLTPAQVLQIIQNTAKPFPNGAACAPNICGVGIIDAGAAVASVAGVPTPTPTVTFTPTLTLTPTITPTQPFGCNLGAIAINDGAAASPYPSTISISGMATSITDVNVQLFGFSHTWPDDTDMLLVGPQGQNLIIMSDAGGGNPGVSNINLTLDDSASQDLPYGAAFSTGSYRPKNYEGTETFYSPAPAASAATTLATFNGTNPNGVWSLYTMDDTTGDFGNIPGGWCLNITTASTPTPTQTQTFTPTATSTITLTPTQTATPTVTETATVTLTATDAPTATDTATVTETATETDTPTQTSTPTATETATETDIPTFTPTATETITTTQTWTPTITETATATKTATASDTPTATKTPSPTYTMTPSKTFTPTATSTATKTRTPSTITITLTSIAAQDGWTLETAETSNKGGKLNSTAATINLGDDATKKQYRGILSFNTGSIPDNATITAVTLKVKKQSITGGSNPFTIFQGLMVDLKNGFFGSASNLQTADFQAVGSGTYGPFNPTPLNNIYSINLSSAATKLNKLSTNGGLTQLRLRFKLDDNNNAIANYLSLFSSNTSNAADRPQLVITYTVP